MRPNGFMGRYILNSICTLKKKDYNYNNSLGTDVERSELHVLSLTVSIHELKQFFAGKLFENKEILCCSSTA